MNVYHAWMHASMHHACSFVRSPSMHTDMCASVTARARIRPFSGMDVRRGSRCRRSRTHSQVVVVAENWQRPDVFGHGREKTHVTMFPFESRELALLGNLEHSERFLSLDGLFKIWGLGPSV